MEQVSTYDPIEGFQPRGQAWDPYRADVPELLAKSNHFAIVPIYYGSNHCFLLTLDAAEAGKSLAVYKPARGESILCTISLVERCTGARWAAGL
jgi:hypothetical protein